MSPTFVNVLPPSVESATSSSPQISPSGSPAAPITRRVHVCPLSEDMPTASPATTSGSVDIATTFERLVGLTAIASSASLPGMAVTLRFEGGAAAASVAAANATANPRTIVEDLDARNRPRILLPSLPRDELGDRSAVVLG